MELSIAERHLLCQCLVASFLSYGICIQQCEEQTTEPKHKFTKNKISQCSPSNTHRHLK